MFNSEFIAIAFRIINFAIVICFFLYLYRRYIAKNIKDQILKYINHFSNLKETNDRLLQESINLNQEIIFQENLSRELNIKVNKWKTEFNLIQAAKLKEHKDIENSIENNLKIKEEYLTLNYIKNEILCDTIAQAKINLKKDFESDKNLNEYQNKLLDFMKKSL